MSNAKQPPSDRRFQSCFTCQGRERSEWCALADEDLRLLSEVKVCNIYQPGQWIFYEGNPCLGLFCVEAGTIGLRKTDHSGTSVLLRLAHGGETLGYRTYFAGGSYRASAEVLQTARVCFIDRTTVDQLLAHNPTLGLQFLRRMADRLEDAEAARLHSVALPVRARLAHLLLVFKERFGDADERGQISIQLPVSRQDMAAMVGARAETIARAIHELDDAKVALFSGRRVVVPDLDLLLNELDVDG